MRLLVQQESNKAFDAKWELERPQREAEARMQVISDLETKTKFWSRSYGQDKLAAEVAYAAGLVARVDRPDPNQLELFAA
jgi:hypothetical protein